MELEGKVAVVTGAGGQIGSVCARMLAAEGARVVASDLPSTSVKDVVAEIVDGGATAVAHVGDVTNERDIADMVATAVDGYGTLDAMVNVAAITYVRGKDDSMETMDVDFWDTMMAVNVRSAMLGCKHAIPAMLAAGGGSIVNFSSTAGMLGDNRLFAYSTTKAAIIGLTRGVATAYGKRGIRCNAIGPGLIWNEETSERLGDRKPRLVATRLTPRAGIPEDIAHMVVYLASDKSEYITGQTIMVDGGSTVFQHWVDLS